MKFRFWISMAGGLFLAVLAHGAGGISLPASKVNGLVVPLYLSSNPQPAVVIRVEKIFKDCQRFGFFRIGVLPMAVAEGVTIELRKSEDLASALACAHHWFKPTGSARYTELRHVTFTLPASSGTNQLTAGRVRFGDGNQWHLLDGVTWGATNETLLAASGTLRVSGAQAGLLTCPVAGKDTTLNLFNYKREAHSGTGKTAAR